MSPLPLVLSATTLLVLAPTACSKDSNDGTSQNADGGSGKSGKGNAGDESSGSGARGGSTASGGKGGSSGAMSATGGKSGGSGAGGSSGSGGTKATKPPPPPGPPGCGLDKAAFCDTFDTPSPGGNAGDLDDATWSAARVSTAVNTGQGTLNAWTAPGPTPACGEDAAGRLPPNDMFFCAGGKTESMHFNNVYNDGGAFTVHSWRVRQLFDFTDRTGIIAFDAAAKSQIPGGHGYWFNVFISEEPAPSPYQLGEGVALYVKGGVGIEFEATAGGQCKYDGTENSVSRIFVEKDHEIVYETGYTDPEFGNAQTGGVGDAPCFKTEDEVMNHVEIHISKTQIEVFASDAGKPETFRLIAIAPHLDLPFTKGYVSFQQTHYNAHKCTGVIENLPQCEDCGDAVATQTGVNTCPSLPPWTSYQMDNVGFDGPAYPTPRSYQIPDNDHTTNDAPEEQVVLVMPDGSQIQTNAFPNPNMHTGLELLTDAFPADQRGKIRRNHNSERTELMTFKAVDTSNASDAALTFNVWDSCKPIKYRFNAGTWRTYNPPPALAPNNGPYNCGVANAVSIPVEMGDLEDGDNTLEMYKETGENGFVTSVIANVELTINLNP